MGAGTMDLPKSHRAGATRVRPYPRPVPAITAQKLTFTVKPTCRGSPRCT